MLAVMPLRASESIRGCSYDIFGRSGLLPCGPSRLTTSPPCGLMKPPAAPGRSMLKQQVHLLKLDSRRRPSLPLKPASHLECEAAAQTSNMAAIPNPSREADRVGASAIVRLGSGPPAAQASTQSSIRPNPHQEMTPRRCRPIAPVTQVTSGSRR